MGQWPGYFFRFGDVRLELETSSPHIARILVPVLSHAMQNGECKAASRILAIDASECDFPPPPAEWPFETSTMDGRLRLCWQPHDGVAMVSDESRGLWHLFDFETMCGLYWIRSAEGLPYWEYGSPLRHFIQWTSLALSPAISMVHGAAVSAGGRGVLLAGPGGSGKSTLTAAALRSGWTTTGDDFVLVDCSSQRVVSYPLYDIMKLTGMAEALFADEVQLAINPNRQDGEKALVPLSTTAGIDFVDSLQLSHIVVVGLSGEPHSKVVPASKFEVVAALAPSTMKILRTGLKQTHSFCCELAHRLPVARLVIGQDPMEAVTCLKAFLEGQDT